MPTSPAHLGSGALSGVTTETAAVEGAPRKRSATLVLTVVIGLAAVLRFVHLGAKSIWADEAFSIFLAKQDWRNFWHIVITAEANMSLYYVLLRGWIHLGDAAWRVRLLSALISVAAGPVVYWIGKEVFSQRAGIVAALLFAVNPFDLRYAQEARGYSLFVLLVSLSFLAFIAGLKRPNRFWNVCYVLTTALALYAHFFAAFVVLVQLVALIALPGEVRRRAGGQALQLGIVVVLGLPLLWFVLFRDRGQLAWAPSVHWRDTYDVFRFMVGSGLKLGIAAAALFIAAAAWIGRCRRQHWTMQNWSVLVLMLWLLLPVFLTLLVSVWKPMYAPRFLIFCVPAALLLLGDGLAQIRYGWLDYAVVFALVLGEIGPIRSYYAEPGQEDWNGAVAFVAASARAGDTAILTNAYCELPFHYALDHARLTVPELRIVSSAPDSPPPAAVDGQLWMITCSATKDANSQLTLGEYNIARDKQFRGIQIMSLHR